MKPGSLWTFQGTGSPFDVVGLGECSLDTIAVVDGLPTPGGKQPIQEWSQSPGGQIATALCAGVRLGLRAAFVGAVGQDEAAGAVLEPLRAAGIDLSGVRALPGTATRTAWILVDRRDGQRAVLFRRAPGLRLPLASLRAEEVTRGRVLLLDVSDLDVSTWAAGTAREAGIPVVLDADTVQPGMDGLLERVDFPIVSREFAEEYCGTRSIGDCLRGLVARGARFAVVTLAGRGAAGGDGERVVECPAFRVEVRDTTGAGDVFHGAFVWGLLSGFDAAEILRAANAAAALSCRGLGAQGALPSAGELEAFLRGAAVRPAGETRNPAASSRTGRRVEEET